MERVLGRFSPQLYALMRIVVGLLFACHGAQKLFGVLGGQQVPLTSKFGLAGIIEFVGGLMIAIGFLTGTAAFIASGEMAYRVLHRPFPARTCSHPERRRTRGPLLLCLSVHRLARRRHLGSR